ncbi:hypothetical protein B0H15DRAFT_169473 [Mycena belliarum]|uniref:Uncharacterized protein n=1 Tax=Mycena belliarum TaxID=1033014 RepID=A0AAD6UB27_9AGAR|nr:hypothetical protein B0H15DRAFT_169473 [Mycena belliae]
MRASTAATFLVGLLAHLVLAAPTAEMVLTPGGYRAKSNIHEIPAGGRLAHVGNMIQVLSANGTVMKAVQRGDTATRVKSAVAPLATGWVAYASWLNTGSSPIASFTTSWKVPAVPRTNNGQTIFLFNSIEPNSGNAILQPVLQYGPSAAGGGSFWAVASWYLDPSNTFFTTPVRTSPGATLNGIITLTSSSGSSFTYNTQFTGIGGTSLSIAGAAQLTWATETLESYGVTTASDYPAGSTVFSGINLKLANGGTPSMSWSTQSDAADGLFTSVNTDGATNAQITIEY